MALHVIELFPIGSIDPDDGRHVAETFSPLKVGLYSTIAPAELVAFIIFDNDPSGSTLSAISLTIALWSVTYHKLGNQCYHTLYF